MEEKEKRRREIKFSEKRGGVKVGFLVFSFSVFGFENRFGEWNVVTKPLFRQYAQKTRKTPPVLVYFAQTCKTLQKGLAKPSKV